MGIKLLIVDDAPFIREILRNIAEKAGFSVLGECENGKDAVEKALSLRPEVILMDLVMPEKNGIEATQEILSEMPGVAILALSTVEQKPLIQRALAAGCREFVTKPFEAGSLIEKIKSMVKKAS